VLLDLRSVRSRWALPVRPRSNSDPRATIGPAARAIGGSPGRSRPRRGRDSMTSSRPSAPPCCTARLNRPMGTTIVRLTRRHLNASADHQASMTRPRLSAFTPVRPDRLRRSHVVTHSVFRAAEVALEGDRLNAGPPVRPERPTRCSLARLRGLGHASRASVTTSTTHRRPVLSHVANAPRHPPSNAHPACSSRPPGSTQTCRFR
jgi:hypothetical protein